MSEERFVDESEIVVREDAASSPELRPGAALSFFFVCLFIVAIYARPEDIFPSVGAVHLTFILGACAAGSFLWSLISGDVSLRWSPELRIILSLTVWFAAGVPFAYWRGGSFRVLTEIWLKTALIFFLLTQTLATLKRVRAVLWAIVLSALVVTLYSLAASSQGGEIGQRMVGINRGFLYWNLLGIALGALIPYMAALFIAKPSTIRSILLASTIASMSWLQVLTASRSGTLVVTFSVILTCWLVAHGSSRGKVVRIGTISALLVCILLAPAVFWERISTITDNDASPAYTEAASADMSKQERFTLLMRSVTYTMEHPLFGLGLGNFDVVNEAGDPRSSVAWLGTHNTYTQISSETGVPGLLLYLALLYTVLNSMKQVMRVTNHDPQSVELNLMARATIVSSLSFAFAGFFAHIGYEYYVYTAPIGVAVGIRQIYATKQIASMPFETNLVSQTKHLSPGWTL